MKKGIKTVCFDEELGIEAYWFEGIIQPFPNHFHDYYVIGFIESGSRCLSCKNKEYVIKASDVLLFNPNDNHGCSQIGNEALDYREINIPSDVMFSLVKEFTRKDQQNMLYVQKLVLPAPTFQTNQQWSQSNQLFLIVDHPTVKITSFFKESTC